MIYLDYNATAPIRTTAFATACELMQSPLNASSIHANGRAAKALLEKNRTKIADIIGCFKHELTFVGCGTEANNMVLQGVGDIPIAICATEHSSILKTLNMKTLSAKALNINAPQNSYLIPVDRHGLINMQALEQWLQKVNQPALVSVMLANNETGVIQNIRAVAQLVHQYGGLVHSDAVQALGKIPVDCNMLQVDFLSISSHKIGGGVGVGALFIANNQTLAPLIHGGGQEQGKRAGTENIASIAAFASAAEEAANNMDWCKSLRLWLDQMEHDCQQILAKNNIVIGGEAERLPNTSCLRMPNIASQTQLIHFDMAGIAVSAGSACSSGRIARSHVVAAMLGDDDAKSGEANSGEDIIRISGGWNTTQAEIATFTAAWQKLATRFFGK